MVASTLEYLPSSIHKSQIAARCQFSYLPSLPRYQVESFKELNIAAQNGHFVQLVGTVTSMSTMHKYTRSTRYICPSAHCPGAENSRYIRLHIPGAHEAQTISSQFHCLHCGSTLEEVIRNRVLGDRVIVTVMHTNNRHVEQVSKQEFCTL